MIKEVAAINLHVTPANIPGASQSGSGQAKCQLTSFISIQNAAAKILAHITPSLNLSHWSLLHSCIKHKLHVWIFKAYPYPTYYFSLAIEMLPSASHQPKLPAPTFHLLHFKTSTFMLPLPFHHTGLEAAPQEHLQSHLIVLQLPPHRSPLTGGLQNT